MRPTQQHRHRQAHVVLGAALAGAAAGVGLLHVLPPDAYAFYPRCPFHQLTGLLCPGCGATRALAALAGGHLALAWQQNALFVALLPALALYLAVAYRRAVYTPGAVWPRVPPRASLALALGTVAFAILRNLA